MKKQYKKGVQKLEKNLPKIMKGIKESEEFVIAFDHGIIACGDVCGLMSLLAAIVHKFKENGIEDEDIKHSVETGLMSRKEIEKELMEILDNLDKLLKD